MYAFPRTLEFQNLGFRFLLVPSDRIASVFCYCVLGWVLGAGNRNLNELDMGVMCHSPSRVNLEAS